MGSKNSNGLNDLDWDAARRRGWIGLGCSPTSPTAWGYRRNGDTLATRLCHIALKERRRLVLGLRESPLTGIALENAARLSREGAMVMPASPFFYLKPDSIEDLVGDFVDRVVQAATGLPLEEGWRRGKSSETMVSMREPPE